MHCPRKPLPCLYRYNRFEDYPPVLDKPIYRYTLARVLLDVNAPCRETAGHTRIRKLQLVTAFKKNSMSKEKLMRNLFVSILLALTVFEYLQSCNKKDTASGAGMPADQQAYRVSTPCR